MRPVLLTTGSLYDRWRLRIRFATLPRNTLVIILPVDNPGMRARLLSISNGLMCRGLAVHVRDALQTEATSDSQPSGPGARSAIM